MPGCYRRNMGPPRKVPAFTVQSQQRNVIVIPPPKVHVMKPRPYQITQFRRAYDGNDLPINRENGKFVSLQWKEPLEDLDYHIHMPIFFDGLREVEEPYKTVANQGIREMIKKCPDKVLPVIPQLIVPLKKALETRIPQVVCNTLRTIQRVVKNVDLAGEALVPYYRQLLSMLNVLKDVNGCDYSPDMGTSTHFFKDFLAGETAQYISNGFSYSPAMEISTHFFKDFLAGETAQYISNCVGRVRRVNIGDDIDYSQQKQDNIGDLVHSTLEILERYGGEDAFINIKYMIPTYESCIIN